MLFFNVVVEVVVIVAVVVVVISYFKSYCMFGIVLEANATSTSF